MAVALLIAILGMWIIRGRHRWALPGLASASFMWFVATFGAYLWNASREFRGSGIPPTLAADAAEGSPAASALFWASVGSLVGVVATGWLLSLRRMPADFAEEPHVDDASDRSSVAIMRPQWLTAGSGALFVAWVLGQGPSLWSRDTYLHTDGISILLTATATPAPLVGATALAASLVARASRSTLAWAGGLGAAWWFCTLAVGTRLAVAFPLAVLVALFVRLVRTRPRGSLLFAHLAGVYFVVYLVIVSFGITLVARGNPHGILRLPELFAWDGHPGPFHVVSWVPIVLRMISSVTSGYVITQHSVLHPAPAEVLWLNANPLPQSIAGIDAYSYERMMPYHWVPLSMAGEWYGVYGAVGQVALFAAVSIVGSLSVDYFWSRKHTFLVALALVVTVFTVAISIQYPSRWFWRLLSISVALPWAYAVCTWGWSLIRSPRVRPRHRHRLSDAGVTRAQR